jgi:3,2-trans-enoyl-CoA isomerase
MNETTQVIPVEHGQVLEVRMNRPPVNALSAEFMTELRTAIERAPQEGAKAIVLSGSPGRFSAGLDVPLLLSLNREEIAGVWRELYALLGTIAASAIPIAAAMTGHAPAGGTVLVMFCDWRVMAAGDYKLGLNEVQVGIQLPPVILAGLRRMVGPRVAEHLAVTGPLVSPQEAMQYGLVDELAEPGLVVHRAVAWCQHLVSLPEAALFTRHEARKDLIALFTSDLQPEQARFTESWFSPSTQDLLRAFAGRLGKGVPARG